MPSADTPAEERPTGGLLPAGTYEGIVARPREVRSGFRPWVEQELSLRLTVDGGELRRPHDVLRHRDRAAQGPRRRDQRGQGPVREVADHRRARLRRHARASSAQHAAQFVGAASLRAEGDARAKVNPNTGKPYENREVTLQDAPRRAEPAAAIDTPTSTRVGADGRRRRHPVLGRTCPRARLARGISSRRAGGPHVRLHPFRCHSFISTCARTDVARGGHVRMRTGAVDRDPRRCAAGGWRDGGASPDARVHPAVRRRNSAARGSQHLGRRVLVYTRQDLIGGIAWSMLRPPDAGRRRRAFRRR